MSDFSGIMAELDIINRQVAVIDAQSTRIAELEAALRDALSTIERVMRDNEATIDAIRAVVALASSGKPGSAE